MASKFRRMSSSAMAHGERRASNAGSTMAMGMNPLETAALGDEVKELKALVSEVLVRVGSNPNTTPAASTSTLTGSTSGYAALQKNMFASSDLSFQADLQEMTDMLSDDSDLQGMLDRIRLGVGELRDKRNAVQREKTAKASKLMVHPEGPFRQRWDVTMVVFVAISGILVPLRLAWDYHLAASAGSKGFLDVLDTVMDTFFILDLALNFRTGFRSNETGNIILNAKLVGLNYMKSWFILDLLASFPFDLVINTSEETGGAARVNRSLRLLRIFKLFRLLRFSRYFGKIERYTKFNPSMIRLVKLIATLLLTWHWIGCLWWFLACGIQDCDTDWSPPAALRGKDADLSQSYFYAFYWAVSMTNGIGGHSNPETALESIFTTFVVLAGVSMTAVVIGNVSSILSNLDAASALRREKLANINQYLRARKVPHELQRRILDYFEYVWSGSDKSDDTDLMKELPPSLWLQLSLVLNQDLFMKLPLFRHIDAQAIICIVMKMHPVFHLPGHNTKPHIRMQLQCSTRSVAMKKMPPGLSLSRPVPHA